MLHTSDVDVLINAIRRVGQGSLAGLTIGVWGASPTGNARKGPAPLTLELIGRLGSAGARVRIYDQAIGALDCVDVALSTYDAAHGADVLLVLGWSLELLEVDWDKVHEIMGPDPRIVDASGVLDADDLRTLGFTHVAVAARERLGYQRTFGGAERPEVQEVSTAAGRVPSAVHLCGSGLEGQQVSVNGLKAKRALDLIVGVPLALAALPLIGLFAIGIAITFRCWPFFTQWREGQNGERFRFLKIRSLPPTTPAYASKFSLQEEALPWLPRFLRKQHLDELPQLLLVPLGKMSLVGPRPKMPDDHEPIEATFGAIRTLVPQGCTGLWQIGEHAHLRVCDSADYDYAYLRYGGVRFDLWILWRTALLLVGKNKPVSLLGDSSIPHWVRGAGFVAIEELLSDRQSELDVIPLRPVAA